MLDFPTRRRTCIDNPSSRRPWWRLCASGGDAVYLVVGEGLGASGIEIVGDGEDVPGIFVRVQRIRIAVGDVDCVAACG